MIEVIDDDGRRLQLSRVETSRKGYCRRWGESYSRAVDAFCTLQTYRWWAEREGAWSGERKETTYSRLYRQHEDKVIAFADSIFRLRNRDPSSRTATMKCISIISLISIATNGVSAISTKTLPEESVLKNCWDTLLASHGLRCSRSLSRGG